MKPATHTLNDLFGADVRYVVPLYQRPYVWKRDTHWRPLWEDVVDVIERQEDPAFNAPSHFLGAVVLDQEETTPGEATRRLVIDGQQRLTTLQLLLSAAAKEADHAGAAREARLLRALTLNNADLTSGDGRFKVWPTNANQNAFRAVMGADGARVGPDDPDNTIHEAHEFFRQAIRAWSYSDHPDEQQVTQRFDALRIALSSLLMVVSINLEAGDNAQVIFETLNARGTPLLAMDLVKNALFYRAAQAGLDTDALHDGVWQPELGDPYWRKERRQGRLKRPRAELFLMHWLAMKLGRFVLATELFSEFRAHVLDKTEPESIGDLIKELCADAAVLRSFDEQQPGSPEAGFFATLEALDTTTVLPVALFLFRTPTVTLDERRRALGAIESWLVRRMLVGLTSKNYNKTVGDLLVAAQKRPEAVDTRIIDELAASTLATQDWPTDKSVTQVLVTRGLYGSVAQGRLVMVLSAIEAQRRRVSAKTESVFTLPPKLTLEHLLPQKWREHWPVDGELDGAPEDLEIARDAALHRLGNLTLTSGPLNSALSNSAWPVKGPALREHSLLLLNAEVSALPTWDVDDINRRGFQLAQEVCSIWPSPAAFGAGEAEGDFTLEKILADAAAAAAVPGATNGGIPLAILVAAGFLDEGETLTAVRRGVTATAVVLGDGRLECGDTVFDSPSGAARYCAGTGAENGWTFWLAERDGERLTLKDIRTQYVSTNVSVADEADSATLRFQFWSGLLEIAQERTQLHSRISPTTDNWISAAAGLPGVHYAYSVTKHGCSASLVIETPTADANLSVYQRLLRHRDAIEKAVGEPLSWDPREGRKSCAVGVSLDGGYADARMTWSATQARLVSAMVALEAALGPHLSDAVA